MASARQHDVNGWYEIEGNPISKAGIFEYLGSTINAPQPDKIYRVYRPESELSDPACIQSFQLIPWVVEHDMLGEGEMPAEKKGIEGVIGQDVFFDEDKQELKGNIKVFSDRLCELIDSGMKELSLGYKCQYDFTPGSVDGEHYDAVQRNLRGNHLATVEEGRMGKDVAVLDHAVITFDSKDFVMATKTAHRAKKAQATHDEQEPNYDEMMMEKDVLSLEDITKVLKEIMPLMGQLEKLNNMDMEEDEEDEKDMEEDEKDMEEQDMKEQDMKEEDMKEEDMEEQDMKEEDEEDEEEKNGKDKGHGMDAVIRQLASIRKDINSLKKQSAGMDSKHVIGEIHQRDNLASKLSHHVGAFDHRTMTTQDVAQYGIRKLGIPCAKGHELPALKAYLHNRKPAQYVTHGHYANDSAEDFFQTLFKVS